MLRSVQSPNKLLYTLGEVGVFGVAGQTKALSYWWIGFLEILHGATSNHTCQCEYLRLLSQSANRTSRKTFCAHHAIGRNANRTVKLKGHQFWSEDIPKSVGSDIIHHHLCMCANFFGPMMSIGHIARLTNFFFWKLIGRSRIVASSSAVAGCVSFRLVVSDGVGQIA